MDQLIKYVFPNPHEIIQTPEFKFIATFLKSTKRTQIGWHYFIDLAWIYSQVKNWPKNFRILDVGGGQGPTQFLLTELGFNVTNIDLLLVNPPPYYKKRYNMKFEIADSYRETKYVTHLENIRANQSSRKRAKDSIVSTKLYQNLSSRKYNYIHERWRKNSKIHNDVGKLYWLQANLCCVPEICTNFFDATVSLSALEHIPMEVLPQAWAEIQRMCKPEAKIAVTTSGTERKKTWFHHPSKGYCFSEHDLQTVFGAIPEEGNYPANEMIGKYRSCLYLKNNLAKFYSKSGKNGMPWGKWNPEYFPLGLAR